MPPQHITAFVDRAAGALWSACVERPLTIVQLGSLSHGGFSARFSDIDLGVLFAGPRPDGEIDALHVAIADLRPPELARRVSLFWSTPRHGWGRLPPIDRVDLCDSGRALRGMMPAGMPRPEPAQIRRDMVAEWLTYQAGETRRFAAAPPTDDADFKELVRCLLYPARFVYTWRTGRVAGNAAAGAALHSQPIPDLALGPVSDALAVRRGALPDNALDVHRARLPAQHRALIAWLSGLPDTPEIPPEAHLPQPGSSGLVRQ